MKLTLEYIDVKDMQFGDKTCVKNGTLYINKQELVDIAMKESAFSGINIDIVKPGESTRIINIADMIEPRCKIGGGDYPGILNDFSIQAGEGTTRVLRGSVIALCDSNCAWAGLVASMDMQGPGVEVTPYSSLFYLAVEPLANGKPDIRDFSAALHKIGFEFSRLLAAATLEDNPDEVEVLDNSELTPGLPNIGYYLQMYSTQHDYESIPESIFYGFALPDTLPLVIQPTEVLDGCISWGNAYHMMDTYQLQNHPVILGLLRRHGKELNFVGMMCGVVSMDGKRRHLAGMMIGSTMKNVFHADGVVMTKTMGGAPHVCEGVAASECEKRGVKTAVTIQVLNCASTLKTEVLFNDPNINAIVQNGLYFDPFPRPKLDKIVGNSTGGMVFTVTGPLSPDDAIVTPYNSIAGALSHAGISKVTAVDY